MPVIKTVRPTVGDDIPYGQLLSYGRAQVPTFIQQPSTPHRHDDHTTLHFKMQRGGSVAEWLACWTQAQNGLGSNRSRDAVG